MTTLINLPRPIPSPRLGGYYLKQPRRPWLVSGIIREGTTVFLSGKEGTGKSFIALELAYCVAEGHNFFGNPVRQGNVVYVAAERGDAQRERLEALRDLKGYDPDSVAFIDHQFRLNIPEDEELFYATVQRTGKPKLIIIDTLRASFEGDENNSWNAQETMNAINRIRRKYDATVVVLHHVNGFGKSRGSSAFIGAADTELYLTESKSKRAQRVYLTVRKQNNGRKWVRYELAPEEIDFGNDFTSIVFHLIETSEAEYAPSEEDEVSEHYENIVNVVEQAGKSLSLYGLQQSLKQVEGYLTNKGKLKRELIELHKLGRLVYTTDTENKHMIRSADDEQDGTTD